MVKQVVWSKKALQNLHSILIYWENRNKSKEYPLKLSKYFEDSIDLISKYPKIGKKSTIPEVRIKVIRDYLLAYREAPDRIEILTIWDSRQNPEQFEKIILKYKL